MIDGHRGQPTANGGDDATVAAEAARDQVAPEAETRPEELTEAPRAAWRNGWLIGKRLVRLGVTANEVTFVGVLLAGATGYLIARGDFLVSIVLLTVGGLMDTLDGVVAKAAGTSSKKGAFLDSVADRVADALIFGGVAWYLAAGRNPRLALIPFAIVAVSAIISYERAKAESLGYDAKGGLMERAERLIFLGVALLLHVVFVPLLCALLALSGFTALQRFVKVWRQASPELASAESSRGAWRRGRVESRWQAWREPRAAGSRPRATMQSRVRARRRDEPLGVRLRRVLATDGSGMRRSAPRAEHQSFVRTRRRPRPGADS
jgi:CDP-diacylglycerol--glycerol-3-phosphate 3-phosphatidyltransferase